MQEAKTDICPMPEPFLNKIGVIIFLGWLFFLGFVSRVIFAPLMPAIESELGISHGRSGTLFLMISIGYMLAPFFSGIISSKINHNRTLALSAWLGGLVLLPFIFTDTLWAISILLILIGLSTGFHLPSAVATIGAEIQKTDLGKAMSIHQLAPPLGFVSAPLIAALLLNKFSWRYVLLTWAIITLTSALLYTIKGKGGEFPGQVTSPKNIKTVASLPSFWIMVFLLGMAIGGNLGIYTMLPLFLVNERSMDITAANTLIGFSQLTGLASVLLSGWIADKAGIKRMMTFSLLAAGISTILLGTLTGRWLILIIFIQPVIINSFFPGGFAALSSVAPPAMRSVASAIGPPVSFLIGGGLIPSLIGYLGETAGFSYGIIAAGCFMLTGPLFIIFLNLGKYKDEEGC